MGHNIKVIRKACTKKDHRKVGKMKKKKKKTCRTVKIHSKERESEDKKAVTTTANYRGEQSPNRNKKGKRVKEGAKQ